MSKTKAIDPFGSVYINISGDGMIKQCVINDIRKVLRKYQGKRKLIVDGKEVNPY